ncbi:sensor histidine kinase [Peterkaempfera griseoplana]|uniref:sensor histidine kinase n=1 Tax=Peterkaempfera griseoplana TaxID=66896 RepID=UPI00099E8867|nr:HAMP domain-containing sensor histidine kinase [Peterkaempfera griseoplana]
MARRALPRTLRARLIAGLLVLLAVTCTGVGLATTTALDRFLVTRLDQQLADAGGRYAASLEHPLGGRPDEGSDTRAQADGTFGARLAGGRVTRCGVVDADADDLRGGNADDTVTLTAGDRRTLAALSPDGRARTVRLSALGPYRMRAVPGEDGDVLVTGLPLEPVEQTVHRQAAVEAVVFCVALVAAGSAGAVWVRLSLRPLRRVADTAQRVSELPLASGRVALSERAPDADPRTEVGRVGAALNRMLGHVEDSLGQRHAVEERLRAFAADASHELRTPVATVRGHAELALRHPGPVPAGVSRALERIQSESLRMGAIVDDLLLLARLDAGRPLAREQVDLTLLAVDCAADARAAGPGRRWRLELPEEPVTVAGDEHRLRQVVGNLLANARAHTPEGTTVTLRLDPPAAADGTVVLTVTDDGPGLPPGLGDAVFDRFVRGDRARSRTSGSTGLGLAIVRAVVTAHGGGVAVESRPGRTVFRVVLPGGPPAPQPPRLTHWGEPKAAVEGHPHG